ncbi:hypothetical protein R1sor_003788 [Riccia sorocarpa]|uniref:Uncharacterized protein n=1 Tax=Riccia sorocarpa TaxID=122646 RepID=A0ABD3H6P3_9MARC
MAAGAARVEKTTTTKVESLVTHATTCSFGGRLHRVLGTGEAGRSSLEDGRAQESSRASMQASESELEREP